MKSDNQRRAEIKARRTGKRAAALAEEARARAKIEAKERAARLKGQVLVNTTNLAPTSSYGTPDFVARGFYVDRPFVFKTCGQPQLWSATQQKWWYEAAKGDVWASAVLCRPCRAKERERKAAAREVHLDGLRKRKTGGTV